MGERITQIKKAILTKPYSKAFIGIFVLFTAFSIWINDSSYFFTSLSSFRLWFVISFLFFSVLIPALVALNINLAWMRMSSIGLFGGASGFSITGIFAGLIGGGCPACFAGLFPAFMGIFGVTASLSSLPLLGLEIQIVSVILLGISIWMLTKDPVCKIPAKKKK